MVRQPVSSSLVKSVGYDAEDMTLEIEFTSGKVYQYFDVPEESYSELIKASSVGSYFIAHIKGAFLYRQSRR